MKTPTPVLLLSLLLWACGGNDPQLLTPDLVTPLKAYDLDNNGNASDIRVDFNVENNLNVIEYRVMVLPASVSNAFDAGIAESIPRESFVVVFPVPFQDKYSISRLPSNLLDVNGSQIGIEISYVVAVLIVGVDNSQLSGFSNSFTLRNQGIYNGLYFIGTEATWTMIDNSTVVSTFDAGGNFRVDLILAGNEYSGTIQCLDCVGTLAETQGRMKFSVNDTVVQNFTRDWPNQPCWWESLCDSPSDPCPVLNTGQGSVVEDLVFVLFMTGDDCISSSNWKYTLIRQL